MAEPQLSVVKKVGSSLAVYLDRGALEKVYDLSAGSEIEIIYDYPRIIIRATKKKKSRENEP